jgi:hypothetical protein
MKKFFATLVLATFLFVPMAQAAEADFTDVSSVNPHYVAISSLVEQEILQGYDDGTFLPDREVNRAEALKIILLGMDVEVNEDSVAGLLFSDVSESDWFFDYVGTAVTLGILQGYDDGTFRPEQTVNRAEALKILMLAGEVSEGSVGENPFADVSAGSWFAPYADYAKTWNIEPPQTDGFWHAEEDVTRANISEMVYRMQLVEQNGVAFEESTNWLTKEFGTVNVSMKVPFGWNYKTEGVGAAWLLDDENNQMSLLTPYDNGGTLLMTRYTNSEGESASSLFGSLEASSSAISERTKIGGLDALVIYNNSGTYFREWYVVLDNGSMVHFLGLRGNGYYEDYLEDYLEAMVVSIEFAGGGGGDMTIEEIVEALMSSIQVDGVGTEAMEMLDDWDLFETDSIGVGTGPVDYYYSPSGNITVKYERSYDVILDVEDGQTSAF